MPVTSEMMTDNASKLKALIVDDEVDNLELLSRVLRKDYEVFSAESGDKALKLMEDHDFFLILTDQRMPNMLGTEFLEETIKRHPASIRILITGYSDIESVIDAINKGAVHRYIKKPWKKEELRREIEMSVQVQKLELENQKLVVDLKEANTRLKEHEQLLQKDLDDRTRQLLEMNQELHKANETLKGLSVKDGLTGLYNHRGMQERLAEEVARARRQKETLSVIFFDVDNFKKYNDTHGHPAGDVLLKTIGQLLTEPAKGEKGEVSFLRGSDIVARYGGEEFVILLPETPIEGGKILAERIRKKIESHPFAHAATQPLGKVTVSVGVANFPEDATEAGDLMNKADQAMYVAKRSGRNQVRLFREIG